MRKNKTKKKQCSLTTLCRHWFHVIQIHQEAISACLVTLATNLFLADLQYCSPRVLQSACSPKPLQIPGFPSILLALENKRTVSSISTTCLVPLDQRTMSGLRLVWVIFSGNLCMLLTLSPPLMEFSVIYEKTHCSAQLFVEMLLFSWILPTFKNAILTYCMFSYLYNKIFWPLNIIHWTQL